ncbi:MAG TPA: VanW family protein [Polyangiaceae bacterium]|nr:VanW family protein [Polyangiaceae bacterium]
MLQRLAAKHRTSLSVGLAVATGLAVGFLLVPRAPQPDAGPPPAVTVLGRPLPEGNAALPTALSIAREYLAARFALELPEGGRRELYLGELGAELDKVHLAALVRAARNPKSALVATFRAQRTAEAIALPVPIVLDRTVAFERLLTLKGELDRLPVDARLDLEKRTLVKETLGRALDVDASIVAIEAALRRGERSARLVFVERRPQRLASQLEGVKFDAVLGAFETRYDRAQKYEARTYNLRLAASKLDGTVLLPGEIFDFNEVVGPRDEANGYKVAPVIAQGELVDGIGGGTCQISGTLHAAAFFAGLEIVERYSHTRPSSYIKLGLDATVVYPTINFRVKNPFSYPVVLHQTVKNGIVRAEILGPERKKTVTLVRRILSATPYEQVERPDKELPHGVRVLTQRGVPGFKLRRYRIVREGAHAVRERWDDLYPPTPQIIRVGTGNPDRKASLPPNDSHSEYLADELLVMTQGPDLDEEVARGETFESREPGRFGAAGWTEKAGMPQFRTRERTRGGTQDNPAKIKEKSGKRT